MMPDTGFPDTGYCIQIKIYNKEAGLTPAFLFNSIAINKY